MSPGRGESHSLAGTDRNKSMIRVHDRENLVSQYKTEYGEVGAEKQEVRAAGVYQQ